MRRSTGREKEKSKEKNVSVVPAVQNVKGAVYLIPAVVVVAIAIYKKRNPPFEEVNLKLYKDKNVRIWRDAENYLHIIIKRTEDDELKA